MNGIHDLGGMTCFGPVEIEPEEPVFHEDWERRVFAINVAAGGALGSLDYRRHGIERLTPIEYLTSSYYENWLARFELLALETGLVSDIELASGKADGRAEAAALGIDAMNTAIREGRASAREPRARAARFTLGDRVRARNLQPRGHTRLPRYVRGCFGSIAALRGTHVFPDANAHGLGEDPQPLYSVVFTANELWGPTASSRDRLYIDLWEDHLEPARRETRRG
jgi:nitrile hydratase